MNTTFTTYAEKKAKQFLNLLQGYTKGIRFTAILILLLMGATNAWAYVTYYLRSNNTTWDTGNRDWGFTHGTTTTTYMDNNGEFKLWRTDWGNDGWFGKGNNTTIDLKENNHDGVQLQQWKDGGNVKYIGPSGMVCFHMDQDYGKEASPWVWITRPTFYLKHNWGGGSWTWKALTDNNDGTYTLTAKYGGTGANYGDDNTSQDGWGYITDNTPAGNPTTSNNCEFKFNSKDKSLTITRLYTITYNGNGHTGGTVPVAIDKKHGTTITLSSSTPTRTGYTFEGWNTKADGSGTNYDKGATYSANADVTLYAQWELATYTITYILGEGGTNHKDNPATYTIETATTELLDATPNAGYSFGGWYSDSEYANQVTQVAGGTTGNITLYAKFEERDLYVNPSWGWGEVWHFPMTQLDNKYTYNTLLEPVETPHLYSFNIREANKETLAYDYDDVQKPIVTTGNSISNVGPTNGNPYNNIAFTLDRKSDVTITLTLQSANDDPKPTVNIAATPYYNIEFQTDVNTQSNPTSVEVKWNEAMPKLTTTPTRTGYTFGGYYADLNDESTKYYNADGTSAKAWDIDDDKTLSAKWEAIPYEITYELNGGTNHANNPEQYDISQEVTLQTPTKANCYFVGWYASSDLTGDPVTTISAGTTGNKTFYAKWASLKITSSPEHLIPRQRLQLGIDYENIPEGYYYVVKVGNQPYNNKINGESKQTSPISGTGSTTYTAFDQINPGTYTVVVGLYRKGIDWNAQDAIPLASATVTIIVEDEYGVGVFSYTNDVGAQDGGIVNTNNVWASEHVGAEVVATPNPGYRFDQWKYIPDHGYENKITFTDAKASTTTIYATAGGQIYANFVARGLYVNPSWGEWLREWFLPMTQSNNKLSYSYNTLSSKPSAIAGLDAGEHNFNIREENEDLAYNFDDVKIEHSGEITDVTSHNPQDPNSNIKFTLSNRSEVTITLELANEGKPTVRLHADRYYTINYKTGYGENTTCLEGWLKSTDNIKIAYAITRPGYTFTGWNSEIDGTGEAPDDSKQMGEQDRTYYAQWTPATYTIALDHEGGSGTQSVQATYGSAMPTITIPTRTDHLFMGYYDGDDGTGTQYYNADGTSAKNWDKTDNTTLHAKWLNSRDCIFFYNNLGWSNVYVYFYNDAAGNYYWADGYGTGANRQQEFWNNKPYWDMEHGKMTQIKGTNIWYYYATYIKTNKRSKVSFANVNQSYDQTATNENSFFQNAKVVYRADLDYEKRLPMFVPHTTQSHYFSNTKSTYYNNGYWMNYPTNTGYKLHIFDEYGNKISDQLVEIPFEYSDNTIMPWSVNVSLEGAKTYAFKIQRADDTWYGNNGTMTTNSSGDAGQTAWEFTTGTNNCKITTTAPGTYVFTLKYDKDRNNNYNYLVGVKYPASAGDYRLVYQDNAHPFHPGHLLKQRDGKDTVSFFVHYNENPVIMLQKVTAINANTGAITWGTLKTYALTANQPVGDNPGQAMIPGRRNADEVILHIGDEHMDGVDTTGIYNFVLEQTDSEATLQNTATKYTGNFYIRTNTAAGGWGNFRQNSNKMTYTSYADNQGFNFNHYFVAWINAGTNVKFTIANEYSYCLSDSLDADDIVTTGNLPKNANVRFGWNSKTNELSRAYIAGSSTASDRFLVLTGNENLLDIAGKSIPVGTGDRAGLKEHELIFSDKQNWIYQLDVQANSDTEITLTAEYNDKVQTFFGTSKSGFGGEPIMQATNDDYHKVRMIYDFKTNNLIAAWLLDSIQYPETTSVASNMLIIREDQGVANQINFTNIQNQNMEIYTAYAVMTFTKEWVKGANTRDRSEYWVSFPFDVKISDVFGFSEYGDKWIMQLYDGAERAEKGNWIDSPTFWKYITNRNYTLRAGVGYVLKLNLSKMTFDHGATDVSLFFPSQGIPTVINAEPTPITVPAHECTIERDNRNIYDSHWNLIGVPGYANLNNVNTKYTTGNQAENVSFYYAYNAADNSYAAAAATANFKNMYAYMVQFAGTIDWKNNPQFNNIPQQLAARHNSDTEPEKRTLRLEIAQGEEVADQTFVQLQQEGATPEFDMNLDLTKIINSGANIYTLAGDARIQVAGNALPVAETTIPVGVQMATAGEYTFRMPDGTEGMVVELVDYETNNRTNLLLTDYTVTLPKGTSENRFALHIQPQKDVVTSLENIGEGVNNGEAVNKYLIDGKLIIRTADGVVYDAQGKRW